MSEALSLKSRDFWVKVVEMLQQNWALIEEEADGAVDVHFIGDTSGIFDHMSFPSQEAAVAALRRNGFRRYAEDEKLQSFLTPPSSPFHDQPHPNGRIYSSGRYWKS